MKIILILIVFTFSWQAHAQEFTGLWEVKLVEVGNKTMTPLAKWIQINDDGTYTSGNGWLQNSAGMWSYDQQSKAFLPQALQGQRDSFGAFTISVTDSTMIWQRIEDGNKVVVTWSAIDEKPKSTKDKIVGFWHYDDGSLFIRWDGIYILKKGTQKTTGYWHVNAHQPELTMISHDNKEWTNWSIEVTSNELYLNGLSASNKG